MTVVPQTSTNNPTAILQKRVENDHTVGKDHRREEEKGVINE